VLISAEILCHLSQPVAMLLDQERNHLGRFLVISQRRSSPLKTSTATFDWRAIVLKVSSMGFLRLLCYLSSLQAYLFANSASPKIL
jgi:hypothetical protein